MCDLLYKSTFLLLELFIPRFFIWFFTDFTYFEELTSLGSSPSPSSSLLLFFNFYKYILAILSVRIEVMLISTYLIYLDLSIYLFIDLFTDLPTNKLFLTFMRRCAKAN